jgi:VanZ family protein
VQVPAKILKGFSAFSVHSVVKLFGKPTKLSTLLFYSCTMKRYFQNVQFSRNPLFKFLPALLVMLAIFLFSARPSDNLPLSLFERVFYKGGHVTGYAMLSLAYWRAFQFQENRRWVAWLLAVLYAATDEYHQSFVPGRYPAAFDVLVYDNLGALLSVWLAGIIFKQKQPAPQSLVVEDHLTAKS